jgi:hypothetical protein
MPRAVLILFFCCSVGSKYNSLECWVGCKVRVRIASDADSGTGGVIDTDAEFGAVSGSSSCDGIV